jgi:transcriptional regulator with XRE-family HTH domain
MASNNPQGPHRRTSGAGGDQTDVSFAEALSRIKDERGLSFRALHEATKDADPVGRGLSGAHISRLCNGHEPPSSATIALIAKALRLRPRYFAEYRLAEARALFDERGPGGLKPALAQLRRLEASLGTPRPVRAPGPRGRRRAS